MQVGSGMRLAVGTALLLVCCLLGTDARGDQGVTTNTLRFDASHGGAAFGPGVAIDPSFDFYKEHPLGEVARQIRSKGFTSAYVVYAGLNATTGSMLRHYSDALHSAGVTPVLRVYPGTDLQLYQDHPEWRQRMLGGAEGHYDWRTYLCPNQPDYVKANCDKVEWLMREGGFDSIQLAELWFEQWGGPQLPNGAPRPGYACVCEACLSKFRKLSGGVDAREMLTSSSSPLFYARPENAALYAKWVDMRVQTIQDFGQALIAAARRGNPHATLNLMYMADARVKLDGGREYQGCDLDRMVREMKPDILTLEDAWQDWLQAGLEPDFVADYAKAYKERLERLHPGIFIMTHADIGSSPASKRSYGWIQKFAARTVDSGLGAPSFYEWSVSTMVEK